MSLMSRTEYDALTRVSFVVFLERVFVELRGHTKYKPNFHIDLICAELEALARGDITHLCVTLPPRNLKSIIVSVAYVAWRLGLDPSLKFICISYGQELADQLARQCRQVMSSLWYQAVFPNTRLDPSRQAVSDFLTTAGGQRFSTSTGGPILGFGADEIIIDDPIKSADVYSDAERDRTNAILRQVVTRLDDKANPRIALVMQRLHEDDPVGHLLPLADWTHINLPAVAQHDEVHRISTSLGSYTVVRREGEALHPERESLEVLAKTRRQMIPEEYAGHYLQMPTMPGGGMIKFDWFVRYMPQVLPVKFERIVISWDTAVKATARADFSVGTVWGVLNKHYYLLDVMRGRWEFPALRQSIIDSARRYGADTVLIEEGPSGTSMVQDLRAAGLSQVRAVVPEGDKQRRMALQTHILEAGRVHIPQDAPWVDEYVKEMILFARARHDDQVDSTSQALAWLSQTTGPGAWFDYYEGLAKGRAEAPVRMVRVRNENPGMGLYTNAARMPTREPDGSFLITEDEWKPYQNLPGWSRVDDDD